MTYVWIIHDRISRINSVLTLESLGGSCVLQSLVMRLDHWLPYKHGELQQQYESKKIKQADVLLEYNACVNIFSEKKGIPQFLLSAIFFFYFLQWALLCFPQGKSTASYDHTHACPIKIVEHQCQWPGHTSDTLMTSLRIIKVDLEGWNIKPKVAIHHSNDSNPERCFVRLFRHYRELCPNDAPSHDCYLQPSRIYPNWHMLVFQVSSGMQHP